MLPAPQPPSSCHALDLAVMQAAGAAAGSAANPEVLMSATTSLLDSGALSAEGLQVGRTEVLPTLSASLTNPALSRVQMGE